MTSTEIKEQSDAWRKTLDGAPIGADAARSLALNITLMQIAYQLAVANERDQARMELLFGRFPDALPEVPQ